MKKQNSDYSGAVAICLVVIILIAAGAIFTIHSDGAKCLANPLKAAEVQASKIIDANMTCSCNGFNARHEAVSFTSGTK